MMLMIKLFYLKYSDNQLIQISFLSESLPLPFAAGAGAFLALGSAAAFFASSAALASSRAFDSSHFFRAAVSSLI